MHSNVASVILTIIIVGFVGLLVSILCQPSEMIITDQASHIGLIQENIALNDNLVCKSIIFDWLNFDSFNVKKYDIVLGLEWLVFTYFALIHFFSINVFFNT